MTSFLDFLWLSFLLLAPMLMLGLFLSGLIHVFISREAILRWLREDSLKSVSTSAAVGVPVPLCSCSVVPVVAEMRNKGASRSSCMSFLITAPETGADSILVTNAFFGFIVAIVRPIISFITAVVAGIFCIGLIRDDRDETERSDRSRDRGQDCDHECDHDHGHEPLVSGSDDCYVSPSQLKTLFFGWVRKVKHDKRDMVRANDKQISEDDLTFKKVVRHIFRYGFVEIADDILFALIVGIALGGVIYLAIPSDLMSNAYARWLSYPVMVLVGVPLYICASASTPIAAALVAKGFSPGAAMIFLMTGPATNTGTIAIIVSQFGTRFASIYVSSVIAVTVVLGIAVDLLLLALGVTIPVYLGPSESETIQLIQWGSAFAMIALIVWRFRAGAFKSGYEDMLFNIRPLFKL
ncbi:MAG: SO_0444 family Cu/Zn efflux transporter [Gemmatimonadetes bacterium]|nr:SO_0444 family Cu/Zn efflux transporter [Gemmatimonadota bacterium]